MASNVDSMAIKTDRHANRNHARFTHKQQLALNQTLAPLTHGCLVNTSSEWARAFSIIVRCTAR